VSRSRRHSKTYKKMDDADLKFFLELNEKYKFLVNEKKIEKTDGFLVVEWCLMIKK